MKVYAIYYGNIDDHMFSTPRRPLHAKKEKARDVVLHLIQQEEMLESMNDEPHTTWVEEEGDFWTNGVGFYKIVDYDVDLL